jgi:hypothetical protein
MFLRTDSFRAIAEMLVEVAIEKIGWTVRMRRWVGCCQEGGVEEESGDVR